MPARQADARDRFVRETLASTVSTLDLLTLTLDTGQGLTPIGAHPIVFSVDARADAIALSTLDRYGMVKPLGLWRLSDLHALTFAQQQAQDDAEDAEVDDVPPPPYPPSNLQAVLGRNQSSTQAHTEAKSSVSRRLTHG